MIGCDEDAEAWAVLERLGNTKIKHHGSEWFTEGTNDTGSLELEAFLAEVAAWSGKLELEPVISIINEAIGLLESFKEGPDLPGNRAKGLEFCTRVGALEELIRSGKPCKA